MSKCSNTVKIGIVGCSGYAFQLIKRIWMLEGKIELIAAFSPDSNLPEALLCAESGMRVFDNFDDFIGYVASRAQAVMNPTPIHRHKEISIRCMAAGLSVWVEKPPVATLSEWDELMAASRRYARRVEVCFNSLYLPAVSLIKGRILAGEFGQVSRIRGAGAWLRPQNYFTRSDWAGRLRQDGHWVLDGTINNPLAHLLCNCLYFAGKETRSMAAPAYIEARLWHGNAIESEDTSSLRIVTDSGIEIVTNMTLCSQRTVVSQMIVDTELASIIFDNFQDFRILWHDGHMEAFPAARENRLDMLETLCRSLDEAIDTPCPLSVTRPFTEVVNAAFYQVLKYNEGLIPQLHESILSTASVEDKTFVYITDIDRMIADAHNAGTLLELPSSPTQAAPLEATLVSELSVRDPSVMPEPIR